MAERENAPSASIAATGTGADPSGAQGGITPTRGRLPSGWRASLDAVWTDREPELQRELDVFDP